MLVVDAGVLAVGLADDGADGERAREVLRRDTLAAPELLDLEVLSLLRRLLRNGALTTARAEQALDDLVDLPLQRASHLSLLGRCWALRENLSSYDASCVALAEALECPLVTTDARLARAPGVLCRVEVLTPGPSRV